MTIIFKCITAELLPGHHVLNDPSYWVLSYDCRVMSANCRNNKFSKSFIIELVEALENPTE